MYSVILIIFALSLTSCVSPQNGAPNNQLKIALVDYLNEEYKTAMRGFYLEAQKGNTAAQYAYALANDNGIPSIIYWRDGWGSITPEEGIVLHQEVGGVFIAKNENYQARTWYTIAALNNHVKAKEKLLGLGEPIYDDMERIISLTIGVGYSTGTYLPKNCTLAGEYYRKALNLGENEALFSLGHAYETGCGEKQNYVKAMQFYKQCIEDSNCEGYDTEYRIAFLLENGHGTTQDYLKAYEWYERALYISQTEQAVIKLYEFSINGLGTDKDQVQAYTWLLRGKRNTIFARNLYENENEEYEKSEVRGLVRNMDEFLTDTQKETAQNRSRDWTVEE